AIAGLPRLLDGMGSISPCANDVGWSARRPTGWRWHPFMEFKGFFRLRCATSAPPALVFLLRTAFLQTSLNSRSTAFAGRSPAGSNGGRRRFAAFRSSRVVDCREQGTICELSFPRIQRVAEPIADEVERQNYKEDRKPRPDRHPGRA